MTAAYALDTFPLAWHARGSKCFFSAFAQVQMSDAPRLLELPDTACPTVGIRLLRYRRPKHWDNVDEPMARLECSPCGHPVAGLL